MNEENANKLGNAIDRLENFIGALQLQLPDKMHVDQLKNSLPELAAELKEVSIAETGVNEWR